MALSFPQLSRLGELIDIARALPPGELEPWIGRLGPEDGLLLPSLRVALSSAEHGGGFERTIPDNARPGPATGPARDAPLSPPGANGTSGAGAAPASRIWRRAILVALLLVLAGLGLRYLLPRDAPSSAQAKSAATGEPQSSILVLPFSDLGEHHDQEYFADGLTEELIQRIGRVAHVRVVARTSAFRFKDSKEPPGEIGRRLGVEHVLTGGVRREGARLLIRADLYRVGDERPIWSQSFEGARADVFRTQDAIAKSVANRVDAMFDVAVVPVRASRGRIAMQSVDAHDLVLQGNRLVQLASRENAEQAIALYQRAIGIAPSAAEPWIGIAEAARQQAYFRWAPMNEAYERSRDAAQRALEFSPDSAAAHNALGLVYRDFDWNWNAALGEFQKSIALEPGSAAFRLEQSFLLANISGDFSGHILELREAIRDDPFDLPSRENLAGALLESGRYAEAVREAEDLLRVDPAFAGAHVPLSLGRLYLGDGAGALEAIRGEREEQSRLGVEAIVYWKLGRRGESDAALRQLTARYSDISSFDIAVAHAVRGESDAAFAALQRAFTQHEAAIVHLRTERMFQAIAGDVRFSAMLRRLNFVDR